MLDTTWSVLQNYVTSFPTLVIKNVGVPIGFTFSLCEDSPIYNDFFSIFANINGFKITDFVKTAESDQGSALKSAISSQNLTHLQCLRHLLVSLGSTEFASQVKSIVCTTCHKDYLKIIRIYEEKWSEISDEVKINELNSTLAKIGHKFEQNKIIITDYDR